MYPENPGPMFTGLARQMVYTQNYVTGVLCCLRCSIKPLKLNSGGRLQKGEFQQLIKYTRKLLDQMIIHWVPHQSANLPN